MTAVNAANVAACERITLETDDVDTVYSFSDSCSTCSDEPLRSSAGTSGVSSAAGTRSLSHETHFVTDTLKAGGKPLSCSDDSVPVCAHVRWHIRRAAMVEHSQLTLGARSSVSSTGLSRSASALHGSRHTNHGTTTTTTTPWVPLHSVLPPQAAWRRRQRVTLDVGRGLLEACLAGDRQRGPADVSLARGSRSVESQIDQFVVPTVSRRHARVTFLLAAADGGAQGVADEGATHWCCQAAEVVDLVSATTYHDVPLTPHHRYHFPLRSRERNNGALALAEALGGGNRYRGCTGVTLGIGRWCEVEVVLETPTPPPQLLREATSKSSGTHARQTVYLDVDTTDGTASSSGRLPSLVAGGDEVLSLLSDTEPVLLVRGKGNSRRKSAAQAAARGEGKQPGGTSVGRTRSSAGDVVVPVSGASEVPTDEKPARTSTATRKRPTSTRTSVSEPPRKRRTTVRSSHGEADHQARDRVIFTTGMELTASEERRLKAAHIRVNPSLAEAARAKMLVVQPPLNRSVKLLTVLPYVDTLVSRGWLEEVLERGDLGVEPTPFTYTEKKTPKSIESTNDFDLARLLRVPPCERQALFKGLRFFVHRDAVPQEPPSNDLKTVLTASGGTLCKTPDRASVLIVPSLRPTKACWKSLARAFTCQAGKPAPLVVTRDDVFKSVLRQEWVNASTVENIPPDFLTVASANVSPRRRSTTGATPHARASRRSTSRPSPRVSSPRRRSRSMAEDRHS